MRVYILILILIISGLSMADCAVNQGVEMRFSKQVLVNAPGMMQYNKLGVSFHVGEIGQGIVEVSVSPAEPPVDISADRVGGNQVVPGRGAFGVLLGSSREMIRQSLFSKYSKADFDGLDVASCQIAKNRKLYLFFSNNKLSEIIAYGRFSTPEGITDRSDVNEILKAYGQPDIYWELLSSNHHKRGMFPLFIYPLFGILCGFSIRLLRRIDSGRVRILCAALLGAILNITSVLLCIVVMNSGTNLTLAWFTVIAGISGAVTIGIYENIRSKMRGYFVLPTMLFVSSIVGLIVTVLWPGVRIHISAVVLPVAFNALFDIFTFFTSCFKMKFKRLRLG